MLAVVGNLAATTYIKVVPVFSKTHWLCLQTWPAAHMTCSSQSECVAAPTPPPPCTLCAYMWTLWINIDSATTAGTPTSGLVRSLAPARSLLLGIKGSLLAHCRYLAALLLLLLIIMTYNINILIDDFVSFFINFLNQYFRILIYLVMVFAPRLSYILHLINIVH